MTDKTLVMQDEIDLRKGWETILKNKILIFLTTLVMGISGILYVTRIESVYHGELMIEIGDVIFGSSEATKPTVIVPIESANDLKIILTQMMVSSRADESGVIIDVPKGSNQIIRVVYSHPNKAMVRKTLEKAVTIVFERHKAKMRFFQKTNAVIDPTVLIDGIKIDDEPRKAQKSYIIIIALVVGLMIGTLLSFFREHMSNSK